MPANPPSNQHVQLRGFSKSRSVVGCSLHDKLSIRIRALFVREAGGYGRPAMSEAQNPA
jgi:hypothetical protein